MTAEDAARARKVGAVVEHLIRTAGELGADDDRTLATVAAARWAAEATPAMWKRVAHDADVRDLSPRSIDAVIGTLAGMEAELDRAGANPFQGLPAVG